jgi:hypothetical protein
MAMAMTEMTATNLTIQPLAGILSRYKLWRSLPPGDRPEALRTDKEFAKYYNVSLSTLRQWESSPAFWEECFAIAKNTIGQRLPEILSALAARAATGNVPAVKLALEVLGVHRDKVQHTLDVDDDRLVVIMPAGMAMPQHLQRSTGEPKKLDRGNQESFELVDMPGSAVVTAPPTATPQVNRLELNVEDYRPAKNPRGPRLNKTVNVNEEEE